MRAQLGLREEGVEGLGDGDRQTVGRICHLCGVTPAQARTILEGLAGEDGGVAGG